MTHIFESAVEQVQLSSSCRCPSLRRTDILRRGLHHGGHLGLSPIHGLDRGLGRGADLDPPLVLHRPAWRLPRTFPPPSWALAHHARSLTELFRK